MKQEKKTFKILSIDGGGIKGLDSSTILEHLEEKYNCSISDHFDMLCGYINRRIDCTCFVFRYSSKDHFRLLYEKWRKDISVCTFL